MKNLFVSVTSIVIALFASAHAITVDLTNVSVNSSGESVVYDDGIYQLVIAPFTVGGTFDNPVFNPTSGLFSNALGVGIDRNFLDSGQVDGFGLNEAVFFEVRSSGTGEVVEYTNVEFNLALTSDNFSVFAGNGVDDLTGIAENVPINPLNQVAMGSILASSMMIAALESNDGFYIQSISFEPVPVPGAALLMLGGMGALSFARKKRRAA